MRRNLRRRLRVLWRRVGVRMLVLLLVFLLVPAIMFIQFHTLDREKDALLFRSVSREARLIATALSPLLERFDGGSAHRLAQTVEQLSGTTTNIKLLFRPDAAQAPENFFFIASTPPVPPSEIEREQAELERTGIFATLQEGCSGGGTLANGYTNIAGEEEVLTSLTPWETDAGCWVVITSRSASDVLGATLGQELYEIPEIRVAGVIYVLMAIVVLSLIADLWRDLRRFERTARRLRVNSAEPGGERFAELNPVPELAGVAREFDRLVETLNRSAQRIREAAEENAHAFKAQLAVISQSLEPLRDDRDSLEAGKQRSLQLIDQSVSRLDQLISAARQMDEVAAEAMTPQLYPVNLSATLNGMLGIYGEVAQDRGIAIRPAVEPGVLVAANEDILETVVENLLDNAISFSPPDGTIFLALESDGSTAVLTVSDEGPGVDPEDTSRIFERYFSHRPQDGAADRRPQHGGASFGIGLWIVRRSVEATGGTIRAENRKSGGLRMVVSLPVAG